MSTELTPTAQRTLGLLCRLNCAEHVPNSELKEITVHAILELHDIGFIELPVDLLKADFTGLDIAKIAVQRTGEIVLSDAGKNSVLHEA